MSPPASSSTPSSVPSPTSPPTSLSERLGFAEATLEVGMTHPAVRHVTTAAGGAASFLVDLDDDRITGVEVEIGFAHRGFEARAAEGDWEGATPFVARLAYASGVQATTAYCLAVESLADIALPDRAIWGRMLASELARIADHFARLAATMEAIGLVDAAQSAHRGGRLALDALRAATQAAPLEAFVVVGGVLAGLGEPLATDWRDRRAALDAEVTLVDRLALANPTALRRLHGVAPLSAEDALEWGVSGPALRATGHAEDVRRDSPYLAYGALEFDLPVGHEGDGLDRVLVVLEEIRQSLRMVDQIHKLLVSLGAGALRTPGSENVELGAGEAVATVEASTGELSFFVASDGRGSPERVRCRAPSFFHAQALPTLLVGARLDDLLPTVAQLHLVAAECDR